MCIAFCEPASYHGRKSDLLLGRREARIRFGASSNEAKRNENLHKIMASIVEGDLVERHRLPLARALAESKHKHLGVRRAPIARIVVHSPTVGLVRTTRPASHPEAGG